MEGRTDLDLQGEGRGRAHTCYRRREGAREREAASFKANEAKERIGGFYAMMKGKE